MLNSIYQIYIFLSKSLFYFKYCFYLKKLNNNATIYSSDEYEPPVVARKANLDDTLTNSEGGDSDVPMFDKKRCRFYSHDNNTNNLQNGFKVFVSSVCSI